MGNDLVSVAAKVRPYLIKKGIDYVEINPSHPHYNDTIKKTVGYFSGACHNTASGTGT